ncbi:MAG: hypothetical protein EA401_00095, partial [Planctomycetota bacterium]
MVSMRACALSLILSALLLPYMAAVEQWRGSLEVTVDNDKARAGEALTLSLDAIRRGRSQTDAVRNRDAAIWLVPQRFVLFAQQSIAVEPERVDETTLRVTIPNDLPGGWYEMVIVMADDYGRLPGLAEALNDRDVRDQIQRQMIAVTNVTSGPQLYLHTERQRQVFSPGEEIRFMVSGRQAGGFAADVVLALYPRESQGRPMSIARGRIESADAAAQTVIFDYPASASAAIADGDYYLALIHDRQPVDRLPIRFISGERASGGARWAHTHPYGSNPGFDASPVIPERLESSRFLGIIEDSLTRIHNANLWVHFFTNSHPILGPKQALPHQDDPDLPPPAAHQRPSLTHSFYQLLMAEGVSLGITLGYGEDYSSEVYMPIPTEIDEHINVMARKYINGSLGSAWLPNFVAVYTDYYGHVDYSGGRELSDEQRDQIRQSVWESALSAAGIEGAEIPLNISFGRERDFDGEVS